MTTSSMPVNVTAENMLEIGEQLETEGGYLLTVHGEIRRDFTITLFDRPTIRFDSRMWINTRHRTGNATNPLEDRQYRFTEKREKTGLNILFPSLDGDAYRLTIAAQWGGSLGIDLSHGTCFYVPKQGDLPEAFAYLFGQLPSPSGLSLTKSDIDNMIAYIMTDLETKSVVREIIGAGMAADVVHEIW